VTVADPYGLVTTAVTEPGEPLGALTDTIVDPALRLVPATPLKVTDVTSDRLLPKNWTYVPPEAFMPVTLVDVTVGATPYV